ncbi:MAG: alpha/beta hydrolase [Lachnospiraceae bacterium]|nr:alpha/beta hydrolase [Lachnospiraceae bacterium]
MMEFWIAVGIGFVVLFCASIYFVYDACFSNNKRYMGDEDSLPMGEQYEPYHEIIKRGVNLVREEPYETVHVMSKDGLKLAGKYYHYKDDVPVVIFFHGYRCCAIRDGNGMFLYSKKLGYNILMVDQRAHGLSEGKTITFGIRERFDCLSWVNYIIERFGKKTRILLTGLSMGAATVLMASDVGLPENVKGIIADCGYSSPKGILKTVMKDLHYPVGITYWMAKLGAKVFGGFDIEEASAVDALKNTKISILLIHGDDDRFVPYSMSEECQKEGQDHIDLVLIKGAGHGMSFCVDAKAYEEAVSGFCHRVLEE